MFASALRMATTPSPVRKRILAIYAFLSGFTVICFVVLFGLGGAYPALVGAGLLAYTLGLRHGVDADHIAAIDNTTRKLMQDGQRPVAVGLFFSLGHSTIVVVLSVLLAISASIATDIPAMQNVGSLIGTTVSAVFLLVIGLINLVVLIDIYRLFRTVSGGGAYNDRSMEDFLENRGLLARIFRPMLRLVRRSWHMYPIGILFGLGFDTASEVGLLGLAATAGGTSIPIAFILILPALFAAGMMTVDTTDQIMMLGAYGWAFLKPIRKLYYNLVITVISVLIAFGIGGIEVLSIVGQRLGLRGGIWDVVANLDFEVVGFAIIGIFIASWAISTFIYRAKGYDHLGSDDRAPDAGAAA
ncbi:MAG: HoxN/HupN/NixA family nickel/cobalt transporter [Chloroflexota bacterium]|nr:MAG: HoxN/HupN/NixA family nickel/cobalt transporter [Chloroflexota bacterium]